ncbi:uncharacterized protein MAM_01939 [Metarhizium album ARSEF 1941]|uniref:N-acetylglucosamine-induced protein 1 n=1 Tax=Metarhizium album (strain ARSEF 1941) TaxID=1081103 RepID=A0A0B2X3X3_METAS|nr:uncharacterized protein MAM_01939 [Metarhizium album ARSEF 1941]KHO00016.1 hypothetical protein MAM_01939 [Metarhizium album ARSEF 1941]
MGPFHAVPFWQVNCPRHELTPECPPFLAGLSEKDRRIVGTPDSAFRLLAWDEICSIIRENRLEAFQRIPSELRRYKAFAFKLAKQHGSIASFVLQERLRWQAPIHPRGSPFQYAEDVKILCNDWPYGLDKRVVHLVVWTKFELEINPTCGDLTDKARGEIDAFVSRTFRTRVPAENVVWFRNWAALKSVDAVEHFHVMMYDADPAFVREVTNGDVPFSAQDGL